MAKERLIVVGNGMVGHRFCETLVSSGALERFQVIVLGEERTPAYDRVHLTDIWQGKQPSDLVLREQSWYAKHDVELKLSERVAEIDREALEVRSESGTRLRYDRLILATGSRVPRLNIPCDDRVEVLSYRTIEDAQRILAAVEQAEERRVVVIGAGLLGLEAARALHRLGCQVTVLEASSQVLPRQLDAAAAQVLQRIIEVSGIELRLRCRIEAIRNRRGGAAVVLEDGSRLAAPVVVAAIGARASDEIAKEAGIACDIHGGIIVDDHMATSDEHIFAIGECAHHPRVPHGLVAPGYAMADVLVDHLMGQRSKLRPQESVTRLKLDLTEVTVLGNPLADAGQDSIWQGAGVYRRLVVSDKRIVAALAIGAWDDLPRLQELVTTRRKVSKHVIRHFAETGTLAALPDAPQSVERWPDTAVVCNCANVSCGSLRRSIALGNDSVVALGKATSAGTLCGSCKPQLAVLCGMRGAAQEASPKWGKALVWVSVVAVSLAALTALVPRLPIAESVRDQGFDVLWIDSGYKQITGFALLGLVACSLLLSLRKRTRILGGSNFSAWRALHGGVGVLALATVFGHTGFRLGDNLNLALMLTFLVSASSGGLSGATLTKLGGAGVGAALRRTARAVRVVHDWVFWPLLVLLGFHILKVYYF